MPCKKACAERHRSGSITVEYALIMPAMLMLLLGLFDTGRLLWTYTTLTRATEAGARCGAVNKTACATATQIKNYSAAQAWGMTVDGTAFTVTTVACGIQVRGLYDFEFIVPLFNYALPLGKIPLDSTACYPS